ncbi:MAG: gfo/Idh/MocA family oxidoreductase [Ruminiclostridium sp.]|nr:gfo/Idh/MocA family oxidoreductase [Ruminiclostridium sp.]
MFKIGIIGSDNSHADAFAGVVNIPDKKTGEYLFPDFKITGIFGLEKKRTEEVATNGKIEYIAERPEDLMGKVDAAMVVFRHGDLHLPYALPFIESGIPTWIDKPFCIKNEDARKLFDAASRHNTLLTGGSSLKYVSDVLMVKSAVENGSRIGKLKTAMVNFPATLENEYGGIYFYGAHLAEMTMKAFGYNARSVVASENSGCVTAIVKYDAIQVTMNFIPDSKENFAVLFGENGTMVREIDITGCYLNEFEKFAQMMRTRKSPESFEHLYAPVELLNAVVRSYSDKKEIRLKGLG